MEITPARVKYWASMRGKPHGHKTSNGKHWTHPEEFKQRMRAIALADGRKPIPMVVNLGVINHPQVWHLQD